MPDRRPLAPGSPPDDGPVERLEPEVVSDDPRLRGVRLISTFLDDAMEIPGTGWRVGLDPIIGLVPGAGDVAAALVSTYVIVVAWRLGAPASVIARVALNVAIDALAGVVPLFGDVADFGWKANRRNLRLLEAWLARPRETRRASQAAVAGVLVLMLAAIAATAWATWRVVAWAIGLLSG